MLKCHTDDGESMGAESLCPAKVFFHRDSIPKPHEMLITTTAGKERYVETNYSPIKNSAGEVEFIVGIIRDIDERKRAKTSSSKTATSSCLARWSAASPTESRIPSAY